MAIKIEPLREAFALANKLADNPDIDMEQRKNYRALESLIWRAFGEDMEAPALDAELKTRLIALNEQMEKIAPRCDWCNAGEVTDDTERPSRVLQAAAGCQRASRRAGILRGSWLNTSARYGH
jgi:hypothetical protein